MEQRSSEVLENVAICEEPSPESLSASVDTSSSEIQPRTPGNTAVLPASPGSAIGISPSTDSGYTEANSSTISADSSTQTQASGGSIESSPSGDATVVIKEGYVLLIESLHEDDIPII